MKEISVWWAGQMRDLLPARLWQAENRANAVLAMQLPDGSLALSRRRRGREAPIGIFATDAAGVTAMRRAAGHSRRPPRVLLRLSADAVLERSVILPIATEPELDRVLAYELDRLTPFSSEEVFWTYAIRRRDTAASQLHLRLALVPRGGHEGALNTLRAAGLAPAGLTAPCGERNSWSFGLAAPGTARTPAGRRRSVRLAATACAALALTAITIPFLQQERALRRVEARIAAARPAVTQVEALRRRIAERAGGTDALASEAARLGRPLEALAALTAILPDDTHLTALSFRQGLAMLTGQSVTGSSGGAAHLIAVLSADPSIRSAAFAAPVTRQEGSRGEVFTIRVEFGS
ncbi:PilN domain-containing protein [Roseomonas sp. GCM10028921]